MEFIIPTTWLNWRKDLKRKKRKRKNTNKNTEKKEKKNHLILDWNLNKILFFIIYFFFGFKKSLFNKKTHFFRKR